MKPKHIPADIYLDGGSQAETREVFEKLGFLDGQTTNPSLIAHHPEARKRLEENHPFSTDELLGFYREVVTAVAKIIPSGSISIEVYADQETTAEAMHAQGTEFFSWIPNGRVKYPTTTAGLEAAERSIAEGLRVNLTLCFSQEQAAAVHAAARKATPGQAVVSPFAGRLDDRGEDGMGLISNIVRMYREAHSPVRVLAASIRSVDHLRQAFVVGSDIVTVPKATLDEWATAGLPGPDGFTYDRGDLTEIPYRDDIDLSSDWRSFDLSHPLTDQGIEKFSADWNALMRGTA